ncbi:putative cell wall protein [Tanacetum coccineum]
MALILIFNILMAIVVAGRDIPNLKEHDDVKQPESFIKHDRGYLIPGIGRFIKPKCKKGVNPFTYNPITGGQDGGILGGGQVPRYGSVGGGRSYVPGGDDTFVPNPGFEVPTPGSVGAPPAPARG